MKVSDFIEHKQSQHGLLWQQCDFWACDVQQNLTDVTGTLVHSCDTKTEAKKAERRFGDVEVEGMWGRQGWDREVVEGR